MARILVTGGAGLIGSNLVKRLLPHHDVRVVDNLWRGKRENLEERGKLILRDPAHFQCMDLADFGSCLECTRDIDVVYHLADVVAGINYVFANEYSLYRTNTIINSHVLGAAIANKVRRYIYVGTACSFPLEKQLTLDSPPLREEDTYPAHPESSYGWSKLMGEYECELAQKAGLLDVGILRFHNVYGPPCEMSPERSQVIPALCRKAIQHPREEFVVWGSGNQRRAFVYVDDVVDALEAVREAGLNQGVIQIGPSQSHSIREIAELVVALSGKQISIRYDTTKQEGDRDRTADFSKAKRILGWAPTTDIRKGLERTYRWCSNFLKTGRNGS
jgi:nucleoside-diphosphate-sugar epimerase